MSGKVTKQELHPDLVREIEKEKNPAHTHPISEVEGLGKELNDLKNSVGDGKMNIAAAITDKGVISKGSDTFGVLTQNIRKIKTGYGPGDVIPRNQFTFLDPMLIKDATPHRLPTTGGRNRSLVSLDGQGGMAFFDEGTATRSVGVVKVDSQGRQVFRVDGAQFEFVRLDEASNLYLIQNRYNGFFLMKYSPTGQKLFEVNVVGSGNNFNDIFVENSAVYVAFSTEYNPTTTIRRLSASNGAQVWTSSFAGRYNTLIEGNSSELYSIASASGGAANVMYRFNKSNGTRTSLTRPNGVLGGIDEEGNLYFASGTVLSSTLQKYSPTMSLIWTKPTREYNHSFADLFVTRKGNVYIKTYDILTKFNKNGEEEWYQYLPDWTDSFSNGNLTVGVPRLNENRLHLFYGQHTVIDASKVQSAKLK